MERSDPVVRRRLVQRVEERLRHSAGAPDPDDREVEAWVQRQRDRFASPPLVRFEQVALGGPSPLPGHFGPASEREVAKFFGAQFAREVMELAPGAWHGPLRSVHGTHRVRVHEIRSGALPPLHRIRERARLALRAEREERALRRALERLRAEARLRIDGESAS